MYIAAFRSKHCHLLVSFLLLSATTAIRCLSNRQRRASDSRDHCSPRRQQVFWHPLPLITLPHKCGVINDTSIREVSHSLFFLCQRRSLIRRQNDIHTHTATRANSKRREMAKNTEKTKSQKVNGSKMSLPESLETAADSCTI